MRSIPPTCMKIELESILPVCIYFDYSMTRKPENVKCRVPIFWKRYQRRVLKMALMDQLILVGLAIVRLVFAIIFAVVAIYIAANVLGRLTKQFKEWDEIKKGNVAVAIYMAGIFISIATIIGPGVIGLFVRLDVLAIIWGFVQLIIALALAVAAQYAGLSVLNKLTKGIDEWAELKKALP